MQVPAKLGLPNFNAEVVLLVPELALVSSAAVSRLLRCGWLVDVLVSYAGCARFKDVQCRHGINSEPHMPVKVSGGVIPIGKAIKAESIFFQG